MTDEEKQKQKEERFKKMYYPMGFKIVYNTFLANTVLFNIVSTVWSMSSLCMLINNDKNIEPNIYMTVSIILFWVALSCVLILQILDWLSGFKELGNMNCYYWDLEYNSFNIWTILYWIVVGIMTVLVIITSFLMINVYI